jgi:DNA-directed RNA polymerase specialized sigma24 family protein
MRARTARVRGAREIAAIVKGLSMRRKDNTNMGGLAEFFQTTRWTALGQAAEDLSGPLAGELLQRYWKPVYCYLRQKGYNNDQAKDLTQGFFQEIVVGRNLLRRADRARGSFRKLLLTAMDHYLHSAHRKRTARKRQQPGTGVSLPDDLVQETVPASGMTPEDLFNYAWISSLLDTVLSEVEAYCTTHELDVHWKVFEDRVLQPIIGETKPPSLADLCEKYEIDSPCKASNMIVTVNRRLQAALKLHIRQYLTAGGTMDAELEELLRFFSKKGAR